MQTKLLYSAVEKVDLAMSLEANSKCHPKP
jgi:hypothetical protein